MEFYGETWWGKEVVSLDISATSNGNTYILKEMNGRYSLLDYIPVQTNANVVLPETVTAPDLGEIPICSIEAGAFDRVKTTMKSLTLSSSVALLASGALKECTSLENIYVDDSSAYFSSKSGVLYSKDGRMLIKYPVTRAGTLDLTVGDYASTAIIASDAFANVQGLTEVKFPASLMVIDSNAFSGCGNLRTVEFTGNTPPALMGAGIFDTTVNYFKMIIPVEDSAIVDAYLTAFNYAEYQPFMVLN